MYIATFTNKNIKIQFMTKIIPCNANVNLFWKISPFTYNHKIHYSMIEA